MKSNENEASERGGSQVDRSSSSSLLCLNVCVWVGDVEQEIERERERVRVRGRLGAFDTGSLVVQWFGRIFTPISFSYGTVRPTAASLFKFMADINLL